MRISNQIFAATLVIISVIYPTTVLHGAPDTVQAEIRFKITAEEARRAIGSRAANVLEAIKSKNMAALSQFVHPVKGVSFTPYTCPGKEDRVFSARQIALGGSNTEKFVWGNYDGSGDPISLALADYFERFVYDAPYAKSFSIQYNEVVLGGGSDSCGDDQKEDGISVQYFMPSTEKQPWRSLRLVFERKQNTWYLTRIIHDEWTT